VTNEDAATLADALERALLDIPGHEISGKEEDLFTTINPEMQALKIFSGERKQVVIKFINLCRKGAFEIR